MLRWEGDAASGVDGRLDRDLGEAQGRRVVHCHQLHGHPRGHCLRRPHGQDLGPAQRRRAAPDRPQVSRRL